MECRECGKIKKIKGRGLCHICYQRNSRHGTLADFERIRYTSDDFWETYTRLKARGHRLGDIAVLMNVSVSAISTVRCRRKKAGLGL